MPSPVKQFCARQLQYQQGPALRDIHSHRKGSTVPLLLGLSAQRCREEESRHGGVSKRDISWAAKTSQDSPRQDVR
ncbi:hypothetical protein BS50DRAFT_580411 [Corynespora cassiicola Philippines]|uniref:Uncharacterized protein n=1 Tax=Corynespora cassiicola Philippines TaxID=1448308 RepID=A0A2T2N1C8_CORCC|nr:hypothetical protein BS50DRAFT_580411 [Corynespora cassiicola Philippines]